MKKLIVSLLFTITLPLSQVAIAQETEITETFSDTDITELEQNICNNSEVDGILLTNQPYETVLDDALVANSSGNYTVVTESYYDDEDDDDGVTTTVVPATQVDLSIVAAPSDPSAQEEVDSLRSSCTI